MDMYRYSLVIPVLDFFLLLGLCQNPKLRAPYSAAALSRFGHKPPDIAFFRSLTQLLFYVFCGMMWHGSTEVFFCDTRLMAKSA